MSAGAAYRDGGSGHSKIKMANREGRNFVPDILLLSELVVQTWGFQRRTGFLAAAVSSSRETRVEWGASSTV